MRLATLTDGTRNGACCLPAGAAARTMQAALNDWSAYAPTLHPLADASS